MKIISRKAQPKFTRKPNTSTQKISLVRDLEQRSVGSSGKKLKINHNVLNLIVVGAQQDKQIELSRLLFTNQKSGLWESAQKDLELYRNSTLSKKMFLEYSPDSVMDSPFRRGNTNDSEILIEGYSQRSEKEMISTNPATNFTFQKSQQSEQFQHPSTKITPFNLQDMHQSTIPSSSITLSLITPNSFIFMLSYTFKSEARTTLSEESSIFKGDSERLINRMRLFFKRSPLLMFIFYLQVLKEFENIQLREFLMKNSIKYSTKEIVSLQGHINQALDMCKGEELLQYMFMTEEEDDMVIINFCSTGLEKEVESLQTNIWKALGSIFQDKLHQKELVRFQIKKIEEFLFKLI